MKRSVKSEAAWAKWRGLIAEQESSGLSVHRFCVERGIPASSLLSWRRKLRDADAGSGTCEAARPGFVEVVRGPSRLQRGVVGNGRSSTLAVELGCGRRIVLERGFDRQLLLEVIEVLERIAGVSIHSGSAGRGSIS